MGRTVVALHCSGAGAWQWRTLAEALGDRYDFAAPEHYGCDGVGPWCGAHAFTLADEAARTLELIDRQPRPVHLVGHSYGGGVALHVALTRPKRIASLALYEPSSFHLLRSMGEAGAAALAEIMAVARMAGHGVITGDYRGAAASFVEYWGGQGAWDALRPGAQDALARWAPKAPLDFTALIEETTPPALYTGLRFPALVLRGEHAPLPSRLLAEYVSALLPAGRLGVIAGAGHMGPLTHADSVNAALSGHIAAAEAATDTAPAAGMSDPAGAGRSCAGE